MKKFDFRLENVLKVRGLHKKMAEREVAIARAKVNKNQQELEQTKEEFDSSFHFLARQDANLHFWHQLTSNYQANLKKREAELIERREELKEKLETEKKNLSRRMKEEKAIEKLKDYQKQVHQEEVERTFQKEIEEIDLLKRGNKG